MGFGQSAGSEVASADRHVRTARVSFAPKLPVRVTQPPTDSLTRLGQRARVQVACADGAVTARRYIRLPVAVPAPADRLASFGQRAGVRASVAHRYEAARKWARLQCDGLSRTPARGLTHVGQGAGVSSADADGSEASRSGVGWVHHTVDTVDRRLRLADGLAGVRDRATERIALADRRVAHIVAVVAIQGRALVTAAATANRLAVRGQPAKAPRIGERRGVAARVLVDVRVSPVPCAPTHGVPRLGQGAGRVGVPTGRVLPKRDADGLIHTRQWFGRLIKRRRSLGRGPPAHCLARLGQRACAITGRADRLVAPRRSIVGRVGPPADPVPPVPAGYLASDRDRAREVLVSGHVRVATLSRNSILDAIGDPPASHDARLGQGTGVEVTCRDLGVPA